MTKLLYCIRHGTALHNINFNKMGRKAYTEFTDTPLVDFGKLEAVLLGSSWRDIGNVELILVSPLTRTLDTAKLIFQDHKIPIIALDFLMEHPQAEEICNLRANKEELSIRYPNVDFSIVQLNKRIEDFKSYVKNRSEKKIAVVSHSSFLGQMMFQVIGDEDNELRHCYPYLYEV
jgi:broad specificity phosphatase PhoE